MRRASSSCALLAGLVAAVTGGGLSRDAWSQIIIGKATRQRSELIIERARPSVPLPPAPGAPVGCFVEAKRRTYLADEQALRLCRCARSSRAVECFVQAKAQTFLADDSAIDLCSIERRDALDCLAD